MAFMLAGEKVVGLFSFVRTRVALRVNVLKPMATSLVWR